MKRCLTAVLCALAISAGTLDAQTSADLYQQALRKERAQGDLIGAIKLYEQVARGSDRVMGARAVLRIGEAYEQLGRKEALGAYRRLVRDFADQTELVTRARARLATLEQPTAMTKSSAGALAVKLLWEGPRIDIEGRPSPDGRYLSFVDWYGTGDLALRDLATGETKAITTEGDGNDVYPLFSSFSADGKRLAYFWTPPNQFYWQPQLRVINVDGTGERVLIENADRDISYLQPHEWTADGKAVLTSIRRQNRSYIALVSTEDGTERIVKELGARRNMLAALSPDGNWIAYDVPPDDTTRTRDVFIVAADGGSEARLEHPANDLHAMFSPKGDYVFFSSDRDGSVGLWAVRLVNGKAQGDGVSIKSNLAHGFYPMGFAGDALFYSQDTGGGNIMTAEFDVANARVTGAPKSLIEQYQGYNTAGYWSADGRSFVYASRRLTISSGQWARTYVRDMTTGTERPLVNAPQVHKYFGRPRPSPDGRYVVTLGDLSNRRGVYLVDVASGERRELVGFADNGDSEFAAGNAEWSRDGRAVYFAARRGRGKDLRIVVVRYEIASGQQSDVVTGIEKNVGGTIRSLVSVSPDESAVAYAGWNREGKFRIFIAPMDGGAHREILSLTPPHSGDAYNMGGLTWTPDSRHILFAEAIENDRHDDVELFAVPVAGGARTSTGFVMPSLRHVSFAPDGKRITFTAGPIEHKEVWVMENALTRLNGR